MSDPITQSVQAQYEAFPYPVSVQTKGDISDSYLLAQYARTRLLHSPEGKRALIAGCGTGQELVTVAQANPFLAEIVGIDLSSRSIEIAQKNIHQYNLKQCQVQTANLMEPDTLPQGSFDFIKSTGVLHHTADPAKALQHLAQRLHPEGVMFLMLGNSTGREVLHRTRAALNLLGITTSPDPDAIQFVQDLLTYIQPDTLLGLYNQPRKKYYASVENLVDDFFHPQEVPFEFKDIPPLLEQAGLEFIDVINTNSIAKPEQVVSKVHRAFYERFQALSRFDQLLVLESLDPTHQVCHEFWCCHQGQKTFPSGFDEAFFLNSEWIVNPDLIKTAQVLIRDQWQSLGSLEVNSVPNAPIKLQVSWLPTPQNQVVLSRFQVCEVLWPLMKEPQSGTQILANASDLKDHVIKLFETWESYRLVLRIH